MVRRARRRRDEHVPLRSAAFTRTEHADDGEWVVRSLAGSAAPRSYRCPGCDQEIPASVPHLVVWPAGEYGTVDDRRHWHTPCWAARSRRRPGRRR